MANSFNIIDLFCGVGGLSYGFERAGFKVLLGIDNDKKPQKHLHSISQRKSDTLTVLMLARICPSTSAMKSVKKSIATNRCPRSRKRIIDTNLKFVVVSNMCSRL